MEPQRKPLLDWTSLHFFVLLVILLVPLPKLLFLSNAVFDMTNTRSIPARIVAFDDDACTSDPKLRFCGRCSFTYEFKLNGTTYHASGRTFLDNPQRGRVYTCNSGVNLSNLKMNDMVTVYYATRNPEKSALRVKPNWAQVLSNLMRILIFTGLTRLFFYLRRTGF